MSSDSNNKKTATRPPVVVILGHVDHGKTSILDKIRKAKVAEGEAGGITQHVGAYQIEHPSDSSGQAKKITFLDTPGHEAFSAIRSRGAKVADVAVLVVAADEGVKPQTKESINILKESEVPFVVAINKIDSQGANIQAVKQGLAENEVLVEGYGGQVPVVEMSAKTGEGIDELIEMILLLAELEDLEAPMEGQASGFVIETHLESRRGIVATLLVQEGELQVGDWVSAGSATGKVRFMEDFKGESVKIAVSSQPVVVLGWNEAPRVGEMFKSFNNVKEAEKNSLIKQFLSGQLFEQESGPETTNKKISNLIIKADTQGSLEAIDQVMKAIISDEVDYRVVNYGVGGINDNDVNNAIAISAAVIGFNVSVDGSAANLAERNDITIKTFRIIYELIEEVRNIMSELLDPEIKRTVLGKIKILALFKKDARSQVVGGKVTKGKAVRGSMVDVLRGGSPVLTAKLGQLQHNKADVTEVTEGLECGLRLDLHGGKGEMAITVQQGDILEVYTEEKIKRTL
ncbi:MAG: translation initiation factor IF-2 [Candidatus Yanofskybacteria bacterium CG10_big_fil_rev_8_21_14_0_10_36_16]|uniref:Translation initiation factor IF-2 n=1 Tax=Candidatus Yanofskybacteria bacterium CG10_big_fil_rev_8_21_14_0_10_36_16 TaxID=1975096 RepID=A0A2J0Q6I8_9BACT|nr:MAG: translation initiation factor IF-2 [Candidatus Yanofskybacteria bacterium CG10_big_fil_rev_8_21_14_0_10_36_16]